MPETTTTLRRVHGEPRFDPFEPPDSLVDFLGAGPAARWDLAFGRCLLVGVDEPGSPLYVSVQISDQVLRDAGLQREVTPAQLREFAMYLLQVATAFEKQRAAEAVSSR